MEDNYDAVEAQLKEEIEAKKKELLAVPGTDKKTVEQEAKKLIYKEDCRSYTFEHMNYSFNAKGDVIDPPERTPE